MFADAINTLINLFQTPVGSLYAATGLAAYLCAAIAIALPPETTPAAVAFRFRWFS